MKRLSKRRRYLLQVAAWTGLALLTACTGPAGATVSTASRDTAEIRSRIAAIREAILIKSAAGIVRDSTADYALVGPDGVAVDRTAFVIRTEALFARVIAIESIDTAVDRITLTGDRAIVEITQTMVRQEQPPAGGSPVRLWLRYREQHSWIRTEKGWRVREVRFLGAPERLTLPNAPGN
ncbi:MAG: nuclear transport factor 2 family protein [Verrucomicrobiota bacterium]